MSTARPVGGDATTSRLSRPMRTAAYMGSYLLLAVVGVGGGWLGAQRGVEVPELPFVSPAVGIATLPDLMASGGEITVRGDVSGLYPGRSSILLVKVTNKGDRPVKLLSLSVTPGDASPACRADNLRVESYDSSTGADVIAARGTGRVELLMLLVDLPNVNQDACRDVTFPLEYAATAVVR